jgi:hypothetical protein
LEFIDRFLRKPPISNFTEIRTVGTALIHGTKGQRDDETNGWTDIKFAGAFLDYMDTPKNWGIRNIDIE